ncbi:hypothetical protein BHM03_00010368 [Ensete ventricosum]|nr:hypothetical protein BHM03_00010368 [Ensete ventricosum]
MKNFVIYRPKSSLIQGSAKMEQATGCPEEITIMEKSSKSVTSNGIVQIGNGESTVEPSSPEQKPEPSCLDDQSERDTTPNRVVSDSGAVKDSSQSKSEIPDATRRKRGRPSSKLAGTKPGGSGAAERSVPPLQQKGSDNGNKTSSTKDSDLKKESDGIGDSDNIEKPAIVTRDSEVKSQRQTSRKISTAAASNLDDNPSSSSKLKEKATSKSKEGSFRSGNKIKDDDNKSKGGIFKDKSTSKTGGGSKDNAYKSIRKSVDGTPKSTGRSTDSAVSASSKVKKDAPKGNSSADSTKSGLKSRGITTPKTGSESKSNVASEKGKAKVRESGTLGKVRSDTTLKAQESEALAGKKRKRKGQT